MIFAIDGGGTTWKTCLVDEAGALSREESFRFEIDRGIEGLRASLGAIFARRAGELAAEGKSIGAIGIGSRGIIDAGRCTLIDDSGRMNFFAGHHFGELIESDLPLAVENDAVAATLGEQRYGSGRGLRHFLLLTLGTGIGGGIIIDGRIYKGHSGMGGHLGHLPVNPEGDRCGCGNLGCVEQEFAAQAFRRRIDEANLKRAEADRIKDVRHLFALGEAGDPDAARIIGRGVFYLARAISGYANAFDPERVILSGGLAQAGDYLMNLIIEELDPILWQKDPRDFVRFSPLGAKMGLYGAGAVGARALEAAR